MDGDLDLLCIRSYHLAWRAIALLNAIDKLERAS